MFIRPIPSLVPHPSPTLVGAFLFPASPSQALALSVHVLSYAGSHSCCAQHCDSHGLRIQRAAVLSTLSGSYSEYPDHCAIVSLTHTGSSTSLWY